MYNITRAVRFNITGDSPDSRPTFNGHTMTQEEYNEYSKEWEEWSSKQGEWPYTPTDPLLDQQTAHTPRTQPSLHKLVTQTIPNYYKGRLNETS